MSLYKPQESERFPATPVKKNSQLQYQVKFIDVIAFLGGYDMQSDQFKSAMRHLGYLPSDLENVQVDTDVIKEEGVNVNDKHARYQESSAQ